MKAALEVLHSRFLDGGLHDTELSAGARERLSRRARVEELAELLREIA